MKTVNITLRVDKELKEQADALFGDMGLTVNTACRMFLKRAVQEQRIPFELRRADRKTLRTISDAEREREVSPCFDTVDELMEDLKK